MSQKGPYRAPRRLYLTADKSRVVEESDPEAASLLAGEGAEVSQADVERYKLHELPDPKADAAEDDAVASGAEGQGKAVAGPPEDKAQPTPPSASTRRASSGAEGRGKDGA